MATAATPQRLEQPNRGVFHLLRIHVVLDNLDVADVDDFEKFIISNGATVTRAQKTTDTIPPDTTHVVSSMYSQHLQESDTLAGELLPVVKPSWVYDSVKMGVTLPDRPHSPNPENVLSNAFVTICGMRPGDMAALKAGIIVLGGIVNKELTKMVTHVVAYDLNHRLCRIAAANNIPIVIPQWVDDCLKLKRRLDITPYLLHLEVDQNGDVVEQSGDASKSKTVPPSSQVEPCKTVVVASRKDGPFDFTFPPSSKYVPNFIQRLMGGKSNLQGAQIESETSLEGSTELIISSLEPKSQLFQNHAFYIGSDLCLSSRMESTIMQIIIDCGGQVTTSFSTEPKPTVYIGRYRDGDEYIWASRSHMLVGNLVWLYYMVANKTWTSPLDKLLHYPVPREGVPSLTNKVISITNYYGDGRAYLIELIETLGAKYTRDFSTTNDFLIAGVPEGGKYQAARLWNVHVINHLWLEECFAKWQEMSLSLPQYTHFPRHSEGIFEVLGQQKLDPETLKQFYMTNQEIKDEKNQPSSPALIVDSSPANKRLSESGGEEEGPTPKKPRKSLHDTETTPIRSRRAAASSAAIKLHKNIEDLNVFQKQLQNKKRNIPLLPEEIDKRRAEVEKVRKELESQEKADEPADASLKSTPKAVPKSTPKSSSKPAKESSPTPGAAAPSTIATDSLSFTEDEEPITSVPKAKGKKASSVGPSPSSSKAGSAAPADFTEPMNVVITGIADSMRPADKKLSKLGIFITEDVDNATHVISDKVKRTEKFLRAMAKKTVFLSEKYLQECVAQQTQVPVIDQWLLGGGKGDFAEAVGRASVIQGRLFQGLTLNYTAQPGMDAIMSIAEAHGATLNKVSMPTGRSKQAAKFVETASYTPELDGVNRGDPSVKAPFVIFICVPGKAEEKKWKKAVDTYLEDHEGVNSLFLSKDWVTHSIIDQQLLFGAFSL
ncbi:BRCT-containing protein 1 [Yarrowia sp. C11]|nr:BRCT-containing protein 1 [Yarrowia sp. E02]KAG5372695.1 BRCT-containing protein 1 [Yarrowia sp. C11]